MSPRYGESNCLDVMGHVVGDENYKWVIRKEFVRCSRVVLENMYCMSLRVCFWRFYICIL